MNGLKNERIKKYVKQCFIIILLFLPVLIFRILSDYIVVYNTDYWEHVRENHLILTILLVFSSQIYLLLLAIVLSLYLNIFRKKKKEQLLQVPTELKLDLFEEKKTDPNIKILFEKSEMVVKKNIRDIKVFILLNLFLFAFSILLAIIQFYLLNNFVYELGISRNVILYFAIVYLIIFFVCLYVFVVIFFPNLIFTRLNWLKNLFQWNKYFKAVLGSDKKEFQAGQIESIMRMINNLPIWLRKTRNFQILLFAVFGFLIYMTASAILNIIVSEAFLYDILLWILLVIIAIICWCVPNYRYDKKVEFLKPKLDKFNSRLKKFQKMK